MTFIEAAILFIESASILMHRVDIAVVLAALFVFGVTLTHLAHPSQRPAAVPAPVHCEPPDPGAAGDPPDDPGGAAPVQPSLWRWARIST